MNTIFKHIRGDRSIWAITAVLALASLLPIYSASTNLVYVVGSGSTTGYLIKHSALLITGFVVIYLVHKIPYRHFGRYSPLILFFVLLLLIYTLSQGTTIGGENASRWVRIPFVGIGFQTSALAGLVLMAYVSRYLSKNKEKKIEFKQSIIKLWLPIACVLISILLADFSTTAILFMMTIILTFIGGYPLKYIGYILAAGVLILSLFILTIKVFPEMTSNRVSTWESRIENFFKNDGVEGYQVEKAKIAVATGGLTGNGIGKSVQKNFLPQSSSDFIYAIILEEYGLIGGVILLGMYFALFFRILIVAKRATTIFGTLLVTGLGLLIIFKVIINMMVAVNILPVTGQTLPLISGGGTSIWMTCFAIGIILSVSASKDKTDKIILDDIYLDTSDEKVD